MARKKGVLIYRVNTTVTCLGRTVVRDCGFIHFFFFFYSFTFKYICHRTNENFTGEDKNNFIYCPFLSMFNCLFTRLLQCI